MKYIQERVFYENNFEALCYSLNYKAIGEI